MTKPMRPPLTLPLKAKLGIGAAALGLLALLAAWLVVGGMGQMSRHMQAVLQAESRIDRYSVLSTQIGRYLVVATEAIQTGLDESDRAARLEKLALDVTATFAQLHDDTEKAVAAAGSLGLNEQSRRATISLSIARMQAQFNATHRVLQAPAQSRERLQGYIDSFAIGFDPNLNAAISEELRGRAKIRDQIDELQQRLTRWGYGVGALAIGLAVVSYLGVIRPQFRRLTQLQVASRQIGAQNFAVSLPETPRDEIGLLFAETNQMARALALRKSEVTSEWARLNETIAQRTEDLRQANAALTQQDQNRRRFFADISHELRTPLTVIMMEAQIGQAVPDPDLAAAFTTIRHRAERLNRRVD
ncbi:MAG: histidine kinase dimerization/phospho-acceptor domain-containing protein, partial [Mangrovicoccus sp.]